MGTNLKLLPVLITIVVIANVFATCKKSECIGYSYKLKEFWTIQTTNDSLNIGDTLSFMSEISNMPFDYSSNRKINFSGNAKIGTPLDIRIIKGLNDLRPAVDSFNYITISGTLKPNDNIPNQIKDLSWTEIGNSYIAKIKIIAKSKGDYVITLPDAIGRLIKSNNCSDGAGIFLTNANVKNNAYLLKPYYSLPNVPANDSAHIFCIRVK